MPMTEEKKQTAKRFLIIAGEVSGDMQAARLVTAIRQRMPGAEFYGIGGEEMRVAGVETFYDVRDMAVMGFSEVLRRLRFFSRVFREMKALLKSRRPDAVILTDYPGFNLRFAAITHAMGIHTIYYICPQVWAWHRSRIASMARIVDHLLTIFPFEKAVFEGTGLKVDFAGHPLVDDARHTWEEPAADLPWQGQPKIALLPGSRRHEIQRILPVMWAAAANIEKIQPGASFIIASPNERVEAMVRRQFSRLSGGPTRWKIVTGQTRQVLRQAKAAMVASGTATIDTALMHCPMIVVYRVSWPTYWMGKLLIRVDHIGMVNIVAEERLCPEFIQHEATPDHMAHAMIPLLSETPERLAMVAGLQKVSRALGEGGAAERAAEAIIQSLPRRG